MITPLVLIQTPVAVRQEGALTVVDNGKVRLTLDRQTGNYGVAWSDQASISAARGEVRLADGRIRKTSDYLRHDISIRQTKDVLGAGTQVTIRHRSPGEPELRHVFWVYEGRAEAIVRLDAIGSQGSNYLAPIVTDATVGLKREGDLRSLFVPYDNDMYFRYRSDGWGEGEGDGDGSYEVGALYDDRSRNGLIVGSIDHDVWKSAVRFKRGGGLRAFAGVTSKYTHDNEPHGTVTGREVRSPRMVLGRYDDWRAGLERYGDLNALVKPALPWKGEVPFGWNSWAGHKAKLNEEHGRVATDFFANELPTFRSGGTAYINFDSFWDNLTRDQRKAFVDRAHAAGLKAGIYFTPFTGWAELDRPVGDGKHSFRDIVIKDAKGQPLPKLDGGWPLDPTHPATLARTDRQLKEFTDMGFDFVKLDFLSHGALEGQHADPKISTGTAAYALGMRRIVEALSPKRIGRPFFISLSIAPMFPHGYAHSRRISCDVFANVGASEYLLNSATYGWWTNNRLYRFNDPDHTCLYQPMDEQPTTEAEARTRLTASVVVGGMLLDGDDLTKPAARERAKRLYTNAEILDLARHAQAFRPVYGDTGTVAGDAFVWVEPGGKSAYVAAFNYDKATAKTKTIPFTRLGLPDGSWTVQDLWTGTNRSADRELTFDLPPTGCALVRVRRA